MTQFLVPITLPADPTNALDAATKQYVDGKSSPPEVFAQASAPSAGAVSVFWVDTDDTSMAAGTEAQTINAQTGTTYTPVDTDAGKIVTLSNAAAITVTLPPDTTAFAVGSRVDFLVIGAGMATFTPGAGVTVNGTPSLVTRAQWSAATAIKRATNTWTVVGDLA